MTRVKCYKPKSQEEPDLLLKLRETRDGVELIAVDEDGFRKKSILEIADNGKLKRFTSATVPGLVTDSRGRIELSAGD